MEKHTPGPWQSIPAKTEGLNQEANALLIAAAPDLLEACKAALLALEDSPLHIDGPTSRIVEAAIAKAEGK